MLRSFRECQLLALSGHAELHCKCPLLGVKRTCHFALHLSACDPKRTCHTSVPPWFGTWLLRLQSLRQNAISDWAAASGVGSTRSGWLASWWNSWAAADRTKTGARRMKINNAGHDSRLKPGAALQRPRSLIGTPGMPLDLACRWCRRLNEAHSGIPRAAAMRCAKAPHGLRGHSC